MIQRTSSVDTTAFPAVAANARAKAVLNACANAYSYGSTHAEELLEDTYKPSGNLDWREVELVKSCALQAQYAENAGRRVDKMSDAQIDQYAKDVGIAVATGLDEGLAAKPERNYTPAVSSQWNDSQKSRIASMYQAARYLYAGNEQRVEGQPSEPSGVGLALLLVLGATAAVGGGWYWWSRSSHKRNPVGDEVLTGDLYDAGTASWLRTATDKECRASLDSDGPNGVFLLDDDDNILRSDDYGADDARRVYVMDIEETY